MTRSHKKIEPLGYPSTEYTQSFSENKQRIKMEAQETTIAKAWAEVYAGSSKKDAELEALTTPLNDDQVADLRKAAKEMSKAKQTLQFQNAINRSLKKILGEGKKEEAVANLQRIIETGSQDLTPKVPIFSFLHANLTNQEEQKIVKDSDEKEQYLKDILAREQDTHISNAQDDETPNRDQVSFKNLCEHTNFLKQLAACFGDDFEACVKAERMALARGTTANLKFNQYTIYLQFKVMKDEDPMLNIV